MRHQFCVVCKSVSINLSTKVINGKTVCSNCIKKKLCERDFETRLPIWKDHTGAIQYHLPEQLLGLSEAEKLLISPLLLYVPLHHMQRGQIGCKGHVCCFEQNIASVCDTLPRMPSDVNLVRVIKQYKDCNGDVATRTFTVRRSRVMKALKFLKKHSIAFSDITIDEGNLQWMEGMEEQDLPSHTYTEDVDESAGDINEDLGPCSSQTSPSSQDNYTEHIMGTTANISNSKPANSEAAEQNKILGEAAKSSG